MIYIGDILIFIERVLMVAFITVFFIESSFFILKGNDKDRDASILSFLGFLIFCILFIMDTKL